MGARRRLRYGHPLFCFSFTGSNIVNRATPAGTHDARVSATLTLTAHVTRGAYPEPPTTALVVTSEVEIFATAGTGMSEAATDFSERPTTA